MNFHAHCSKTSPTTWRLSYGRKPRTITSVVKLFDNNMYRIIDGDGVGVIADSKLLGRVKSDWSGFAKAEYYGEGRKSMLVNPYNGHEPGAHAKPRVKRRKLEQAHVAPPVTTDAEMDTLFVKQPPVSGLWKSEFDKAALSHLVKQYSPEFIFDRLVEMSK